MLDQAAAPAPRADSHVSPSLDLPALTAHTADGAGALPLQAGETRPPSADRARLTLRLPEMSADGNLSGQWRGDRIELPADRRADGFDAPPHGPGISETGDSNSDRLGGATSINVLDRLAAADPSSAATSKTSPPSLAISADQTARRNPADSSPVRLPTVAAGESAPAARNESLPLVPPNAEPLRQQLAEQREDAAQHDQAARAALDHGVLNALIGPAPTTAQSAPTTRPTLALPWK